MNRSKDLKKLFKAYMVRKEEENRKPASYVGLQGCYNSIFRGGDVFHGVIFFYEWSDITRVPIRYFSIPLFEKFLSESNIELLPWQKDIIMNLPKSYITCRPGCSELAIRSSYEALSSSIGGGSSLIVPKPNGLLPLPTYVEQYY